MGWFGRGVHKVTLVVLVEEFGLVGKEGHKVPLMVPVEELEMIALGGP